MASEVVVEVTGDCVLLDPGIIDLGVETFLENDCDVVTNVVKPAFPMGVDVQVYRYADLERVEREVRDPAVREHVSLFFYRHPDLFRIVHLLAPARWRAPESRWQLDYPEDLAFLRQVHARLVPIHGDNFGIEEVTSLLRAEPELSDLNAGCMERPVR
jgi:spore coat polysaccharide biosynthesis protein SpsF